MKTRPITLLNTMRKAIMKLLINHLSHILLKHFLLKGKNHASLSGDFTEIPIKLMQMIIEDVKCHDKLIWILFQNLFKAYDRVDLHILYLSILYLKIPIFCINFIINFFTHRKNAVFTTEDITNYYQIKIGINQEDYFTSTIVYIF